MEDVPMDTLSLDPDSGEQVEEDKPQGMERRLVLRLLGHWRSLTDDGGFPSFANFDPAAVPDMWDHAFVLDVAGRFADPLFRITGDAFAAYSPISLTDLPVSQAPRDTVVEKSVKYFQEVLHKQVPITRGGEFLKPGGIRVLYRSIILPMSDDGETVSGLLGAANCREDKVEE